MSIVVWFVHQEAANISVAGVSIYISERVESINNILLPKSDNMVRQAVTDVTNILRIFSTLIRFWNLKRVPDISHLRPSAGDCKSETAKQH